MISDINTVKMTDSVSEDNNNLCYKKELLFKYLVIGDYGVGKTSIIRRYAEDTFSSKYKITIGADFAIKTITWDNYTTINLQLWDIAGHERFGALTSVYYRYALAAALVFDLTRPETLNSIPKWLKDLRNRSSLPNGQNLPVILLANKGDVNLDNIPKHLDEFCKENNILTWFITSAKENINLDIAMNTLIDYTLHHKYYKTPNEETQPLILNETEKPKNGRKRFCFF
ncbi:PREDICTED: ras-related protein Rab-38-like [Nicrophorus vespilloides]|uniref:Ras-related protein Rab-38-like n=1 Tax=Nicrophorus vespilloides TaxID=110193 RepID=A0ABM1N6D2_NICVS|nr:PREDICTED: ras-related protein Rab-38-like [Nicrophorus vespilloides]